MIYSLHSSLSVYAFDYCNPLTGRDEGAAYIAVRTNAGSEFDLAALVYLAFVLVSFENGLAVAAFKAVVFVNFKLHIDFDYKVLFWELPLFY